MQKSLTVAAVAAGLLLAAGAARAEQPGPYVSLGIGANWLNDAEVTGSGVNDKANFKTGLGLMGAAGYAFDRNWRAEAELGFRGNKIDRLESGGGNGGHVDNFSLMGNVLYDVDTGTPWTPYLGAGAGLVKYSAHGMAPTATTSLNDSDTQFAYQGIAGIGYQFTPSTQFFLDYHYLRSLDPTVQSSNGTHLSTDNANNTVMIGIRYSFGAPPPAAPAPVPVAAPAPTPAPAPQAQPIVRSFQVFFDFDKANIRPDARPIIEQAAENARKGNVSKITLTGHTDRAGSAAYNQRLSVRRAEAVKAELVRMGFNPNDVAVVGKGETDPLVPTADGVREPRNRRVEIVF